MRKFIYVLLLVVGFSFMVGCQQPTTTTDSGTTTTETTTETTETTTTTTTETKVSTISFDIDNRCDFALWVSIQEEGVEYNENCYTKLVKNYEETLYRDAIKDAPFEAGKKYRIAIIYGGVNYYSSYKEYDADFSTKIYYKTNITPHYFYGAFGNAYKEQ